MASRRCLFCEMEVWIFFFFFFLVGLLIRFPRRDDGLYYQAMVLEVSSERGGDFGRS